MRPPPSWRIPRCTSVSDVTPHSCPSFQGLKKLSPHNGQLLFEGTPKGKSATGVASVEGTQIFSKRRRGRWWEWGLLFQESEEEAGKASAGRCAVASTQFPSFSSSLFWKVVGCKQTFGSRKNWRTQL